MFISILLEGKGIYFVYWIESWLLIHFLYNGVWSDSEVMYSIYGLHTFSRKFVFRWLQVTGTEAEWANFYFLWHLKLYIYIFVFWNNCVQQNECCLFCPFSLQCRPKYTLVQSFILCMDFLSSFSSDDWKEIRSIDAQKVISSIQSQCE